MKRFKSILLCFICVCFLVSCNLSNNGSSSLSSTLEDKYKNATISDMIRQGEGKYHIQGSITRTYTNNDQTIDIWVQNYNVKKQQEEAIVLKNCSFSENNFKSGDYLEINGKYKEVNGLPQMVDCSLELSQENDSYLHGPLTMTINQLQSFSMTNLNRLVKLQNCFFSMLGNIDIALKQSKSQIVFQNNLFDVILKGQSVLELESLLSKIKENSQNGGNIEIVAILDKKVDQNEYQLLVLDDEDITFALPDQNRSVQFYAINDFHGSVIPNGYEAGILKVGSFFKSKKEEGNTLLMNSGDMWQGAIESNYNRGQLLTDCMNYIEFDCFTLGNHEFDWGNQFIQSNRQRASKTGYQTPFLAANIYQYDINSKLVGNYANLGDEYTIRTLDNGLKVGIIGVIGRNQITSITSQYVDDLVFQDPTPIVKKLSDELRVEKDVDVVVLDCHTDQASILASDSSSLEDNVGITEISPVSNERYVDAVFCAHSHQNESALVNGVPFIQGSSNGKMYSSVSLKVASNGAVELEAYSNSYTSSISNAYNDQELKELIESYTKVSDQVGQEVLGTISDTLYSSSTLVNFVTAAMADFASKNNIPIDYAISNTGRANLSGGEVTYANLYKSLPFDNQIYVIEATGSSIRNELRYNSMYRVTSDALQSNKTYTIAVLDYLALHRNTRREYDYFPNASILSYFEKTGYAIYNYRDLTADFIRSFNNQMIDISLYDSSNIRHDISRVNEYVSF